MHSVLLQITSVYYFEHSSHVKLNTLILARIPISQVTEGYPFKNTFDSHTLKITLPGPSLSAMLQRCATSNASAEVDKRSKIAATYTGIDRASTARLISSLSRLGLGAFMEPTSLAITPREFGIKTTPGTLCTRARKV